MKNLISIIALLFGISYANAQDSKFDPEKLNEDLTQILSNIENYYIYLDEKNIDLKCIERHYREQIPKVENNVDAVLLFENLLNEFYDNHIHLNVNTQSSYRLYSPIYTTFEGDKAIISNVWQTQIESLTEEIMGAQILKFNGVPFNTAVDNFPSHCMDKNDAKIREWVANRVLSGKRNESRILSLKLANNEVIEFDLDELKIKNNEQQLSSRTENEIGIIRINNSLGNNNLISEFDSVLDQLMSTKGLIIDLRNTVGGGNSYVGKAIMSRFTSKDLPYQKHVTFDERWDGQAKVGKSWVEYVSPRGEIYEKPVVVLVGRWTGSMGEGVSIGFDGMERAEIIGSEMGRLAGATHDFKFKNLNFGYQLLIEKLYHINGTAREKFVPTNYVNQTTITKDQPLEKAIGFLQKQIQ